MSDSIPPDRPADAHAVIVGGGIAGLACAVALADAGLRPIVVERITIGRRSISVMSFPVCQTIRSRVPRRSRRFSMLR